MSENKDVIGPAIKGRTKSKEKHLAETGVSIPLTLEAISSAFNTNFSGLSENRYAMYRKFLRMDPELNQAVTRLALLGQSAYKGPVLRTDETPTDEEKELIKRAIDESYKWDFRARFYTNIKHLLRDGDSIFVAALADAVGIQQIKYLPMSMTTCVENKDQIGKADAIIQERNIYVVNEMAKDLQKMSQFPADSPTKPVYHIGLDNDAEEIYDNLGRYTFGIWSESPIDCLKTQVLWKQALKITDILWRYRNVPREVHKLDTSMFIPEKFGGATYEAQLNNAMTAAQAYLTKYATDISAKKVDQGYIVGSNVQEIYYIQPGRGGSSSGQQATAPNKLIDQLNASIREGLGAYSVGQGTYATELVTASYVILMPDWAAYKVKRALVDLLRKDMKMKWGYKDEELERLDIRLNLVLDILKGELARQVALLAAAGVKTKDELRDMMGDQPLTQEQKDELAEESKARATRGPIQTGNDQMANAAESQDSEHEPITPESRADKQST